MLPMSERPPDRERRQIGDENGRDRARLCEVMRVNRRHDGVTEIQLYKDPGGIEIIEYDLGFQFHAFLERRRFNGTVVRRASGKPKIADALEVLQLQPLVAGQWIRLRDQQKQALTCHCPFLDSTRRLAGGDEAEIGLAEPQDLNAPLG